MEHEKIADRLPESPYGIICEYHGEQGLSKEEYTAQMWQADSLWKCPICSATAWWDDDRYERHFYPED